MFNRLPANESDRSLRLGGQNCWTLFDSGARNTNPLFRRLTFRIALSRLTPLLLKKSGGTEDGNPIEVLFGALAMPQWGLRLNPAEEKLGLSHYPREFVEF